MSGDKATGESPDSGIKKGPFTEDGHFSAEAEVNERGIEALDDIVRRSVLGGSNGEITPEQNYIPNGSDLQRLEGIAPSGTSLERELLASAPKPGGIYRIRSGGRNDESAPIYYCVKTDEEGGVESAWMEWLATKQNEAGNVFDSQWVNYKQKDDLKAKGYEVEEAKAPKIIGSSGIRNGRSGSLVFVTKNPYLHWALSRTPGMTAVMPRLDYGFNDSETNIAFRERVPVFLAEGDLEMCKENAGRLLTGGYVKDAYVCDIPAPLRSYGIFKTLGFDKEADDGNLLAWLTAFGKLFEEGGELGQSHYAKVEKPEPAIPAASSNSADFLHKLECDKNGRVKPTIENVRIVLQEDPSLSGFHYDIFKNKVYVTGTLPWIKATGAHDVLPREWGDKDDSGLRWCFEANYGITHGKKIEDGFRMALMSRETHPVREYLDSLEWDGVPRLGTLLIDYWGADDNIYTREAASKHLVAAVARVFVPGAKKDEALVLVGRQGIGKSTFIRTLAKSRTGENDWFSDSVKDFGEKNDDFMGLQGKLFIELGELAGLNKKGIEQVKQFLSKQSDDFRVPYGKRVCAHPRQCVFWGSTNESKFLNDTTGGRRFWPIQTHPEKALKDVWSDLPSEVDQIWAEAVTLYRNGESLELGPEAEAIAKEEQEFRLQEDSRKGVIEEWLKKPVLPGWRSLSVKEHKSFWSDEKSQSRDDLTPREYVCAAEVLCELFDEKVFRANTNNTKEINKIFESIDFLEHCGRRKFGEYGRTTAYKVVSLPPPDPVRGSPGIQQNTRGENSPCHR